MKTLNRTTSNEGCDITIMDEDGVEIAQIRITPGNAEQPIVAVCGGMEKRFSALHLAEKWIERICAEENPPTEKPKCRLIGQDSNVFNLISIVSRTLKDHKQYDAATEMGRRVMQAKSYDEALHIMGEYVEIE